MFSVLALAAEYKLQLRAERHPDGIAALRGLIADGESVTEAAHILKIGRSTALAAT
jgi:hypothetical protein